ncbi:unnamed protein product [Parascedosporium putredinis]|uniref:Phosphoglycerate mutase-like protein n=1 Tax=Parascedosporium putredinis TaxID=1442378 RepID=A0A9P1MFF8_9PEZI|nr:unnamed protein product [Parascedosporium putredinis]CAI8004966.1 unnamed protein product [Parascedosporium putredinis]
MSGPIRGGIRLLLIRHGESVDNAKNLAKHLSERDDVRDASATVLFASDLERAWHTADVVREALSIAGSPSVADAVVQSRDLREKHFGSLEGVKLGRLGPMASSHQPADKPETSDSMMVRAYAFLRAHLIPIVEAYRARAEADPERVETVVVVSHGILLNHLVRALLGLFQQAGRPILGLTIDHGPGQANLHLPWRNTGYCECWIGFTGSSPESEEPVAQPVSGAPLAGLQLEVLGINCIEHLASLKKTRGGIGSAKFDASQKTLDTFFTKKP